MTTRDGETGFTLVEVIIWGSILLIAASLGMPALQMQLVRARLVNACEQVGAHALVARMEAVKLGTPVVLSPDYGRLGLVAWLDENDDQIHDATEEEVFNISVPGGQSRSGVYYMGPDLVVGTGAEPAQSVDGLTTLGGGSVRGAVFEADGSIRDTGAFRLADVRTPKANICEIRIEPAATARVEILKYVYDGPNGDDFYASGSRTWEWY